MNDIFKTVFDSIGRQDAMGAIKGMRSLCAQYPYLATDGSIDQIEEDFRRMADYMLLGYSDPGREAMYAMLLQRIHTVAANARIAYRTRNEAMLSEAAGRIRNTVFTHDMIKDALEGFVAETAMLELEPEDVAPQKEAEIYKSHHGFVSRLFDHILVSGQWKNTDAAFFEELMLSPTIDLRDAMLIASAITMSNLNEFDIRKLKTLVNTYKSGAAEPLRQRALVGWAISMPACTGIFHDETASLMRQAIDEDTARELADLQKQIILCMNAEKDNEKIQRDIMPTLIRNNNFSITRDGIVEKDEDPLDDILNPQEGDKRMEELERSMSKMIDMQKTGSDIYFGGFSQMKRFPFFYTLSNWFMPFYVQHPDLKSSAGQIKDNKFLGNLMENGPFCESDKYSFAIAMASVLNKIPENMREMMNSAEAMGFNDMSGYDMRKPEYIRRMYLQDLYRFFRLHPQRNALRNPFEAGNYVIVNNDALDGTSVSGHIADLCFFFYKQDDAHALSATIPLHKEDEDARMQLLCGIYEAEYNGKPQLAAVHFQRLLETEPANERGMKGLARAFMEMEEYSKALDIYKRLHEDFPGNKSYTLNYCVALAKNSLYEEALKELYRFDYENPDNANCIRLLAWSLMGLDRLDSANKEYARLLGHERHNASDYLNAGYCKWFSGEIRQATECFKTFVKENGDGTSLRNEFLNDYKPLTEHGVTDTDIRLMISIVEDMLA